MFTKDENDREIHELRLKYELDERTLLYNVREINENRAEKGVLNAQIH
jgi:hypothetical protein